MNPRTRGFALGLVVIIITVMFIAVFAILQMMRGVGSQASYSDAHVRALAIAESGVQALVARLMAKPWDDRWIKSSPDYHGSPVAWDGGTFVYAIQDTPNASLSVDIWVKSEYKTTKRLLFYRVKYQDLLFKGLTNPSFNFTASIEQENQAPALKPAAVDALTDQMNQLIDQREKTRGAVAEKWEDIADKVNPSLILANLGANTTGGEIPSKSASKDGTSTDVVPRPKVPLSAGGQGILENYDKNQILDWINKQGYDSELAVYLISVTGQNFMKIDTTISKEKYTDAGKMLKALLKFLHRTSRRANAQYSQAKMRYQAALDALNQEAQQTGMAPAEYSARKAALCDAYRAELQAINQEFPAP